MKITKTTVIIAILVVLALDWLSKYYFNTTYPYGIYHPILGEDFFGWLLVYNKGVSFSIGASDSTYNQFVFGGFATVVGIALTYLAFKSTRANAHGEQSDAVVPKHFEPENYAPFAYALIGAGGLGNGVERLVTGHVVDFISFTFGSYHFPVFNVADIAINIGVLLLIVTSLLSYNNNDKANDTATN